MTELIQRVVKMIVQQYWLLNRRGWIRLRRNLRDR